MEKEFLRLINKLDDIEKAIILGKIAELIYERQKKNDRTQVSFAPCTGKAIDIDLLCNTICERICKTASGL